MSFLYFYLKTQKSEEALSLTQLSVIVPTQASVIVQLGIEFWVDSFVLWTFR